MTMKNSRSLETWDPFFRQVQENLIEPLGLENVTISVDRHQGENGIVGVTLKPNQKENAAEESSHDDLVISRKQLTVNQLTVEVQSTLNVLLQDCAVRFGDITFVVNHGRLVRTVVAFSMYPHESTREIFVIGA